MYIHICSYLFMSSSLVHQPRGQTIPCLTRRFSEFHCSKGASGEKSRVAPWGQRVYHRGVRTCGMMILLKNDDDIGTNNQCRPDLRYRTSCITAYPSIP